MAQKLALVATVTHDEGRGQCPVVSNCTVKLSNGVIVAGAKLGGKWKPEQVVKELRTFPNRFKQHAGYATAKLAGFV